MLPINRIVKLYTVLCCFLGLVLAKDDPEYNATSNFRPRNVTGLGDFYSWIGSYYNATAEVELTPVFGDELDGPMCSKLKNYTTVFKYDAILSIIERGSWNSGSNSALFWLSLLPETSPPFNVSALGADLLYQNSNVSYPAYSVDPSPNGYWRPREGSGPDRFNFTTTQLPGGAYNLSGSMVSDNKTTSSSFRNVTLPVCNTTHLNGDYTMSMEYFKWWWSVEDWDDFRSPSVSVQFDKKTANLTLDGVFIATPFVRFGQAVGGPSDVPTLGGPSVHGFIQVRFSGVIDPYHSDSLSLDAKTPTWLRTVGFGNDSSNVGYDSAAGKPHSGSVVTLIAVVLLSMILL